MEKRGQITVLIMIGIVIIAALVIIFSLRNYVFKKAVEKDEREQILGEAIKPIKIYLDDCIKDLANNAIERISLQGGYINIPNNKEPINPLLPFSNNLDIFGNNALRVTYWFYESDNGIQRTDVPTLREMETRIGEYIDSNINACLNNITFFEDYEISKFKDTKTSVAIGDNSVIIKVKTSVGIGYKGLEQELNSFNIAVDSSLGKLYKIGKEIFDNQNKNLFFEDKTYDIMSLYKEEIPISNVDFSCSTKTWNFIDIYNNFKEIISANIQLFKVVGTKYDNSDRFYLWRNAVTGNHNDVTVNFLYSENFPTYLDVNPRNGNILMSNNALAGNKHPYLALLCMQYYNFIYNVKYPILVTLTDDKGYTFQYAIQVILKNNQARENLIGVSGISDTFTDQFCDYRINEMSVYVSDEINNPVNNAEISYKCSGFVCGIGKTKDGVLIEKFPNCFNGFVVAKKDRYSEGKSELSTDEPGEGFVVLKRIYKKPLKVLANGFELKNDEEAIITFEGLDDDYLTSVSYPDVKEVELIEGDYNVSIMVSKKGNFFIKGEDKKQCIKVPKQSVLGLLGLKTEECFDIKLDDLNLDSVILGRSEFTMFAPLFDLKDDASLNIDIDISSAPNNYDTLQSTFSNFTFATYEFIR